ncbi:MAG: FAD:protein FMN transferase [Ignavibacteria bacterium]|nr:FAD:protein FMN transferase [Ignavibacteria bacterium]
MKRVVLEGKEHPVLSRRSFMQLSSALMLGTTLGPLSGIAKVLAPTKYVERAAFTMGSIVTIKAYCDDERLCNRAIEEAFGEMKEIDKLMSVFDPKSQVSVINHHSGRNELEVDSRIIQVLSGARTYNEMTEGAFDVTLEPLMELYGFRDDAQVHHFPSDKQIAETLDGVGMLNIVSNDYASVVALKHPRTKLDFGGIAVGYALDQAAHIVKSHGIESALINHSGDLYAIGTPPDTEGWEIGITDPQETDKIITTVHIKDQALSTSGNYENFIQANGQTIGHILDPSSGRTARTILSGTVIADTAIQADALSTGFFVLGMEKTASILQQSKDIQFISIVQDGDAEKLVKI